MYYQLIFLSIISSIYGCNIHNGSWNYGRHGPDVWAEICSTCGGRRQSPINIQTACTVYENFHPFSLTPAHNETLSFTLNNNGHTITAEPTDAKISLTGRNLDRIFSLVSFHLHWGPNHNTGSDPSSVNVYIPHRKMLFRR
ncbi:unnamed protein product [Rotaria sp. Silwood1]|nr:unnamed protein product [Rotaria sp. Silwood1]